PFVFRPENKGDASINGWSKLDASPLFSTAAAAGERCRSDAPECAPVSLAQEIPAAVFSEARASIFFSAREAHIPSYWRSSDAMIVKSSQKVLGFAVICSVVLPLGVAAPSFGQGKQREPVVRAGTYSGQWHKTSVSIVIEKVGPNGLFLGKVKVLEGNAKGYE